MIQKSPDEGWKSKMLRSRFLLGSQNVRPADVGNALCTTMLARGNVVEDVRYHKVVPNQYIIEVSPENYTRNYQMIEPRILKQWNDKLLEHLMTANSRLGRKEYHFAGSVQIAIRPASDLKEGQVRILWRVQTGSTADNPVDALPACLQLTPGRRRWHMHRGVVRIGREPECEVHLDLPDVQERRLISGVHAYIVSEQGEYRLFDGDPGGKASTNGTYVNNRQVPFGGLLLQDGDMVTLAALNPGNPQPGTPGTVTFRFSVDCGA